MLVQQQHQGQNRQNGHEDAHGDNALVVVGEVGHNPAGDPQEQARAAYPEHGGAQLAVVPLEITHRRSGRQHDESQPGEPLNGIVAGQHRVDRAHRPAVQQEQVALRRQPNQKYKEHAVEGLVLRLLPLSTFLTNRFLRRHLYFNLQNG